MYFSNFPQTLYQISAPKHAEPAQFVALTDITKNIRFKKEVLESITLYDLYNIKEGDSMEATSERLYGSPYYHWVLMLLNDRYDWRNDFPLESFQFDNYIRDKYGTAEDADFCELNAPNNYKNCLKEKAIIRAKQIVSFYRDSRGFVVDSDYINPQTGLLEAEAISAYDHELAINDSKRLIKIISPDVLSIVLNNFRNLL